MEAVRSTCLVQQFNLTLKKPWAPLKKQTLGSVSYREGGVTLDIPHQAQDFPWILHTKLRISLGYSTPSSGSPPPPNPCSFYHIFWVVFPPQWCLVPLLVKGYDSIHCVKQCSVHTHVASSFKGTPARKQFMHIRIPISWKTRDEN